MKKTALAVTPILCMILCLFAFESQTTTVLVKGNAIFASGYIRMGEPVVRDGVTYDVPENKTYYSSTIIVSYRAIFPHDFGASAWGHKWIFYSLDGGENVTAYDEYNGLEGYNGSLTLSGLSSGDHFIDIYSKNGTYVWGPPDWGVYSDATERDYFSIVLSGESQTPTPTVAPTPIHTTSPSPEPTATPTPAPKATPEASSQPETFPASLIFVTSVGIALAVTGLIVYFKKVHRNKTP
jgi:hypothetical protein